MIKTRLESDSVGELSVPSEAYYGIQSLRAKNNFDITGNAMSPTFIKNITLIKKAAAIVFESILRSIKICAKEYG